MAEQTDNSGREEEETDADGDRFAALAAKYVTFMEASPGVMKVRPKGQPDAEPESVPVVIAAVAEGLDIERFTLQQQDAGNMACEIVTALAYMGVEWARRVAGAIAMVNRDMAAEFGPSAGEGSAG